MYLQRQRGGSPTTTEGSPLTAQWPLRPPIALPQLSPVFFFKIIFSIISYFLWGGVDPEVPAARTSVGEVPSKSVNTQT